MAMPKKKVAVMCYYTYADERVLKFCVGLRNSLQLAQNFQRALRRLYPDWFDIDEVTTLEDDEGDVFVLEEGTANPFDEEDALFRLEMLAFADEHQACDLAIEHFFRTGNLRDAWDNCNDAGWVDWIVEESGIEEDLKDMFYYTDPKTKIEYYMYTQLSNAAWVRYVKEFITYDDVVFAIRAKIEAESR